MKKFYTLAVALLASFGLWAATESNPTADVSSNDSVVGTSYTIMGDYVAGLGGTKAGDMQTKGIKFRLNRAVGETANAVEFKVNEGYVISQIDFCGHVNDGSKTSTINDVKVDGASINFTPVNLPVKTASVSFSISGIQATESIVLVFQGEGTQANLEYTITYDEATTKTVVSTEETITAITVNGDSLSAAQIALINDWHESYEILHTQAYATAPTVKFSRHTVITYDDESTKVKDEDIEVVAEHIIDEFTGEYWQASLVGTDKTFKLDMFVASSAVITYMDGETVLGRDTIAQCGTAAEYAQYQSKELATFGGWYNDAALTDPVDLTVQTFSADATIYGKFTKAYASSLNIEQIVLDNGKGYDIRTALTAAGFAYKNINDLDSLNDEKTARNEPYLGLKIKAQGGYIACNLRAGDVIRVKFGYVAADVKAYANDQEMTLTPVDNALDVLEYTATAETFVKLQTTTEKTVVIKQIMINEAIADVTLPGQPKSEYNIAIAEMQNGSVLADKTKAAAGDIVTLTVTPAEGYKIADVKVNDNSLNAVEGVYSFEMPEEDVTITATFEQTQGIDEINAEIKAVKRLENGLLIIEKNGILYNVQGARVR